MERPQGSYHGGADEEFVPCPYDRSHLVSQAKILMHLAKCRRNYLHEMENKSEKVEMVNCSYNLEHQMPIAELKTHEALCGDRHSIVGHLTYHQSEECQRDTAARSSFSSPNTPSSNPGHNSGNGDDEDWGKDSRSSGYDPNVKNEGFVKFKGPEGITTKSERKAFQKQFHAHQDDPGDEGDLEAEDPYAN